MLPKNRDTMGNFAAEGVSYTYEKPPGIALLNDGIQEAVIPIRFPNSTNTKLEIATQLNNAPSGFIGSENPLAFRSNVFLTIFQPLS